MMKERIVFKKVGIEDIRNSVKIIQSSFNERYLETSIYTCHGIVDYLYVEFSNKYSPYIYFGLYLNNAIIAFSEFKLFNDKSTAFLNIIAVDTKFSNCKLGTSLLSQSLENLNKMGLKHVELDVYSSNINALNWYLKFGFTEKCKSSYAKVYTPNFMHITKQDLQILNYPQSTHSTEKFGFGIISILYKNKRFELGIINNNLIIRNSELLDNISLLNPIVELYHICNIYYIGEKNNSSNILEIDEIKRLKFSI